MDKKVALSEVQAMKGKPVGEYIKTLSAIPSAQVKLSEDMPDDLSAAHQKLSEADVLLSESRLNSARVIVKQSVDADIATIGSFVKAGKITPVVGAQLVALCERKRANQLIHLAEGMPDEAADEDGDVNDFIGALGNMPDNMAVEDQTQGAVPGAEAGQADPTQAGGGDAEGELMALAQQIAQKEGIPFEQALVKAEQMLAQDAGGGPA